MQKLRLILPGLLVTLLLTAVPVLAQTEGANSDAAAGIVLGILGLVLIIIFTVAVIGAVGLGVIGLGYRSVQSDED